MRLQKITDKLTIFKECIGAQISIKVQNVPYLKKKFQNRNY
jgi:hypothetical protein